MAFPFQRLLRKTGRGLQHPRLLFTTLAYFMALLVVGTFAQKAIGLFAATHRFFNSFVVWCGPVPLPAGASVMALLFVNLGVHFLTHSQWHRRQLGITLSHLSVLVLLFGGGVTLLTKTEGFVILRRNDATHTIYDYHARHFQITHRGKIVYATDPRQLHDGQSVTARDMPFTLRIAQICGNCTTADKGETLSPLTRNLTDETSQMGVSFTVDTGTRTPQSFIVTEFGDATPSITIGGERYDFTLRRQSMALPFSLLLEKLSQDYYPNTDIAQNYASTLSITENHRAWPVLIAMNSPLRYKGYTFYQSSVLTLPGGETASVLNVVDNAGWLFPYLATALLCFGLGFHTWVRYARR